MCDSVHFQFTRTIKNAKRLSRGGHLYTIDFGRCAYVDIGLQDDSRVIIDKMRTVAARTKKL